MARTQQERLDELQRKVEQLTLVVETLRVGHTLEIQRVREVQLDMTTARKELQTELAKTTDKLGEAEKKLAVLEERARPLEKGFDRLWQLAPIVISGLAPLVSFLKKKPIPRKLHLPASSSPPT